MAARSHPKNTKQAAVERDLTELMTLLPALFRGLRHAGPELRDVEPVKRAFYEAGLGNRHGRILLALASTGPQSVGELAAHVALTPATTSLLVGELDRAGFVERREDEHDHRRTIVSVPEHLHAAVEQFARVRLEPLRRGLQQLDPEARTHLLEGLRVLTAEAEAAAARTP
jgi:DNA-binding MarR family transcriptional regulator